MPVQTYTDFTKTLAKASAIPTPESPYQTVWKEWAKPISSIDPKQSNGFMYVGEFVKEGTIRVNVQPSLYLVSRTWGSRRSPTTYYALVYMDAAGTLSSHGSVQTDDKKGWALRILPDVEQGLARVKAERSSLPVAIPQTVESKPKESKPVGESLLYFSSRLSSLPGSTYTEEDADHLSTLLQYVLYSIKEPA